MLDEVKADLAGWPLNRTVWVVDAGCASADNSCPGNRRLKKYHVPRDVRLAAPDLPMTATAPRQTPQRYAHLPRPTPS